MSEIGGRNRGMAIESKFMAVPRVSGVPFRSVGQPFFSLANRYVVHSNAWRQRGEVTRIEIDECQVRKYDPVIRCDFESFVKPGPAGHTHRTRRDTHVATELSGHFGCRSAWRKCQARNETTASAMTSDTIADGSGTVVMTKPRVTSGPPALAI